MNNLKDAFYINVRDSFTLEILLGIYYCLIKKA